jgi:putative chitobiose transport system permease protein
MSVKAAIRQRRMSAKTKEVRLSRSRGGTIAIFIFLALICCFMALPVVYAILQSIKPIEEYYVFPPRFFVQNPTFQNYRDILTLADNLWVPFSRYVFNTLFVSIAGTAIYVVISLMAGYALAKSNIRAMKVISNLIVWGLLFTDAAIVGVQYLIVVKLGIYNTYLSLILPALSNTMGVFLLQQFIQANISDSILEAARIDGAGEFTILFRVVAPSVKAGWITVLIFQFQSFWNNNLTNMAYSEELKQLSVVLQNISAGNIARAGSGSAVVVLMMIPMLVIFIWSQRSIMNTMAHSGLK